MGEHGQRVEARRRTEEAQRLQEEEAVPPHHGGGERSTQRVPASLIEGYDDLSVEDVEEKLGGLSDEEIGEVRDYEKRNKERKSIVEQLDRRL